MSPDDAGPDLARAGRRAHVLAGTHPGLALQQGSALFRQAAAAGDLGAAAVSALALGVATHRQGRTTTAIAHLEEAAWLAWRVRDPALEAEARSELVRVLDADGQAAAARRQAAALVALGRGAPDGRPAPAGADELAAEYFAQAEAGFYAGDLDGVDHVLGAAQTLVGRSGGARARAELDYQWGRLAWTRRELAVALCRFASAAASFEALHVVHPQLLFDHGRALLEAGLAFEARELATDALAHAEISEDAETAARLRLLLAWAALVDDDPAAALESASVARIEFARAGRQVGGALARLAFYQAAAQAGLSPADPTAILDAAGELDRAGLYEHGSEARMIGARIASNCGLKPAAAALLERVACDRRAASAEVRARGRHAHALQALARGDEATAARSLRAGLAVLDAHRAAIDANPVNRPASVVVGISALGLRLALGTGRAAAVLEWAERAQRRALRVVSVAPVAAEGASRVRLARFALLRAALSDEPGHDLRRDLERAEARLRQVPTGAVDPLPTVAALQRALAGAVFVEYAISGGDLWAIVVTRRGSRMWSLGPLAPIEAELAGFTAGLRQMATGHVPAGSDRGLLRALDRLDAALLAPLADALCQHPLVVVPTGVLQSVPWPLLPSATTRTITVAPSGSRWLRSGSRPAPPPTTAVLLAGPGATRAGSEVRALAALYDPHRCQAFERVAADQAVARFGSADLAHVVASGTFRADNPLFSTIDLADGPLAVHRLLAGGRVPGVVVLSTCRGAFPRSLPGDDVMALATVLLDAGARSVIASPLMVPDPAVTELMVSLHARLAGSPPAAALSAAQAEVLGRIPAAGGGMWARTAVGSYCCVGAG